MISSQPKPTHFHAWLPIWSDFHDWRRSAHPMGRTAARPAKQRPRVDTVRAWIPCCNGSRRPSCSPLGTWLRADFTGRMDRMDKRLNVRIDGLDKRIDGLDQRLDGLAAQVGDLRERMAKLEGAVEGFMAGWRGRDRDAA